MDPSQGSSNSGSAAAGGPVLFKRKTKRGGSNNASASGRPLDANAGREEISAGPSTSSAQRARGSDGGGDGNSDDDGVAVVRTRVLRGRAQGGIGNTISSRGRRDALGQKDSQSIYENDQEVKPQKTQIPSVKRANVAIEQTLGDSPSASAAASSLYSTAALAELKAATPNRQVHLTNNVERCEDDQPAYVSLDNAEGQVDTTEDSLARVKYGADFAHDAIPSQAAIIAAKEKRRRGLQGVGGRDAGAEDFISLSDTKDLKRWEREPHPESRLQREEDEIGSGGEEFAEYTGAQDRIALGQSAREKAKREERRHMQEAVDMNEEDMESDDSGQDWETAQMQRMQINNDSERKQRSAREPSPFKPAPIPRTAPLPQIGATSTRLRQKLMEIEESARAHDAIAQDADKQLAQLREDEQRNKQETEAMAEREAWFRELQEFIGKVARFLHWKLPTLEAIEADWSLAIKARADTNREARALTLEDYIACFHGVPSSHVSSSQNSEETFRPPIQDGDALSETREARRRQYEAILDSTAGGVENILTRDHGHLESFKLSQSDVLQRLDTLMSDVQAPEFRDPAARIERADGSRALHPASLVARFHRWRRLYPEDYSGAWGGLALAGIWDFWIRLELCRCDLLRFRESFSTAFGWYAELAHYSEHAQHLASEESRKGEHDDAKMETEQAESLGGDDEVVSHALTSTFLRLLTRQIGTGTFDAWSADENTCLREVAEQLSYVLEKDNPAFQSFVASVLNVFDGEICALGEALARPPAAPPMQASVTSRRAFLLVVEGVARVLMVQLVSWHRFVAAAQRPLLLDIVARAVSQLLLPLLDRLRSCGTEEQSAASSIAADILQRCARPRLIADEGVRARLAAIAGQPPPAT